MSKLITLMCVLLVFLIGSACGRGGADFVFRSGGVYTLDGDRPWAESVAVDGGKIVAVGSDAETAAYIGRGTEVIDLAGKMLLPGFQDSHTHPILGASLEPLCRLDEATSREAVLLGRSVRRASSPSVVGRSCSSTRTSSCEARSMACDPVGRVRSS